MSEIINPWGLELISLSTEPNDELQESIKASFIKLNRNLLTISKHIKFRLTAPLYIYVDSVNGNDTNTGLSSQFAFKNISKALEMLSILEPDNHYVNIKMAAGTYSINEAIFSNKRIKLRLIGNESNPSEVQLKLSYTNLYCIKADAQCELAIRGIRFIADSASLSDAIENSQVSYVFMTGGLLELYNCEFDRLNLTKVISSHIRLDYGAKGILSGPYKILGGASYHINLNNQSSFMYKEVFDYITINITGDTTFNYLYSVKNCSSLNLNTLYTYKTERGVTLTSGYYLKDLSSSIEGNVNTPVNIKTKDIESQDIGYSTCKTPLSTDSTKNIVNTEWVNNFFFQIVKPQLNALIRQATGQDVDFPFIPPGAVFPYAGSDSPAGYLLCDGSEVSKSTYSVLYNVIGNKFGNATSSSKFKLPDLRGRVIQGVNQSSNFDISLLGQYGGNETVTLSESQLPTHTHNISSDAHTHDIEDVLHSHGINDLPHSHYAFGESVATDSTAIGLQSVNATLADFFIKTDMISSNQFTGLGNTQSAVSNITLSGSNINATASSVGNNDPIDLRQPYLSLNYIIKC